MTLSSTEALPPRSGAVHYWRLPRRRWRAALEGVRALGLGAVETYIPWSVHENGPGEFDFGERDRRKDVGAFLDLAHELDLQAIVRPGPHINAELTFFGIPERVLNDAACQARSARGNPVTLYFPPRMFAVPSYASERYAAETARWFEAVAEVLAPRLRPRGAVEWVQIDNEAGYYFRNGPYGQDYHPDARALYAEFILERYGSLHQAALAHGQPYSSVEDIPPPTRFSAEEQLARHLDWAEFQERLITRSLARMRAALANAGLRPIKTFHNISLGDAGLPLSLPGIESELDLVGLDYYHRATDFETIRRRTLYLAGSSKGAYAPELGAGAPPWFPALSAGESLFCAHTALAFGLRSFNLYMAVDRDRWYGAPLDDHAEPRAHSAPFRQLHEALDAVGFESLRRPTRVGIVWPRVYLRLSRATHVYGPLSPSTLEIASGDPTIGCRSDALGHGEPVQTAWWEHLERLADALTRARVPFVHVDSDVPDERLAGLDLLFVPTFKLFDRDLAGRLAALAARGTRVVCGPRQPSLDALGAHAFPELRDLELDVFLDADRSVAKHVDALGLPREPEVGEGLVATVHENDDGRRVLFVLTPPDAPREATLPDEWSNAPVDLLVPRAERLPLQLPLELAPRQARLLRLPGTPMSTTATTSKAGAR